MREGIQNGRLGEVEGRAVTKGCMEGLSLRLSFIFVVSAMFRKSNLLIDSPSGAFSCSQGQR